MLVAFSRGYLEPYYEHGIESRVRERVLLNMLNTEMVGKASALAMQVTAPVIGPHMSRDHLQSAANDNLTRALDAVDDMYGGHKREIHKHDIEAAMQAGKAFEGSEFYQYAQDTAKKIYEELMGEE